MDFITDHNQLQHNRLYSVAWSWQWPQRICVFIWKILANALLSNEARVRRHLTHDASCERCGADIENLDHIFRTCAESRVIWYMILPYSLHATFFTQDFDSWMNTNLQNEDNVNGRKWSRVFAVTLDNIWLYRNKTIFESFQFQPHGIV